MLELMVTLSKMKNSFSGPEQRGIGDAGGPSDTPPRASPSERGSRS